MEQGEALWSFERRNKPDEQLVRRKRDDTLSQAQKTGQEQGTCRMDVTQYSPSPADGQQRRISGVLMKRKVKILDLTWP